jgi:hypothetical protein
MISNRRLAFRKQIIRKERAVGRAKPLRQRRLEGESPCRREDSVLKGWFGATTSLIALGIAMVVPWAWAAGAAQAPRRIGRDFAFRAGLR